MQFPQPYIYTSPRMVALVDRPQMAAFEGIIADPVFGYHSLWAAEVPFVPTHGGKDDAEDAKALDAVAQRQKRFLYDLAQASEHLTTFELRLISQPQAHGPTRVAMAFLCKVFHSDEARSHQLALGLWDKFSALFPREAPFSYPLVPVERFDTTTQPWGFLQWFLPLPFEKLTAPQSIIELRKHEDWPTMRDIGRALHARDYIPHPFVASDHSALARLLETMARQQAVAVVAITLRPQRLSDLEIAMLHEFAGWYRHAPAEAPELVSKNRLIQQWRELHGDSIESYKRARSELGQKVYEDLIREHRSLFLLRLQVVGDPVAQDDIIEALGSQLIAHTEDAHHGRRERVMATSAEELSWAIFNLQWLEFARWGISPILQQDRRIIRLRQLATVAEAAAAFRLPIATGRGALAGIQVRDEPFTIPARTFADFDERCVLGTLLDRGVATTLRFSLPPQARTSLTLLLGDDSDEREQLLRQLLAADAPQPWIRLRMGATPGTRLAERQFARYISLDSAAPSGSLNFHPFLPPTGIPLATFLDALLRVMQTVCALDSSTTPVLRRALHEIYLNAGWTSQQARHSIDLAALAEGIDARARQETLPSEVARALRTRCVPPLQDLALMTGHLQQYAAGSSAQQTPSEPAIIDIGWLGSDINNALLYGCLWIWYALALPRSAQRGTLAAEDAHLLFAPAPSATASRTPMASFLRSSLQTGSGIILIDDRPDLLDSQVTSQATTTIVMRSSGIDVLECTAKLIGASASQQARMAQLQPSEAVVRLNGMPPVQIALETRALEKLV